MRSRPSLAETVIGYFPAESKAIVKDTPVLAKTGGTSIVNPQRCTAFPATLPMHTLLICGDRETGLAGIQAPLPKYLHRAMIQPQINPPKQTTAMSVPS